MRHVVETPQPLGEVLRALLPESSGRTRKQYLENGRVRINGEIVRKARTPLAAGDVLETTTRGIPRPSALPGVRIVYEDDDVIVIDKAPGLLTVATAREREETAYRRLTDHVKKAGPRSRVFIVHRLDRLASGLLVFARTPKAKSILQTQLRMHSMERRYVVLCEGCPQASEGVIDTALVEDKTGRVHETRDRTARSRQDDGSGRSGPPVRMARTRWRRLEAREDSALLEIQLESGRKHQIRVHLAGMRHPVAGDPLYGRGFDPIGRLALHARTLAFDHPADGERKRFEAPADWSAAAASKPKPTKGGPRRRPRTAR